MAFIGRGAPGALKNAAVKGAVVGAADMAAMKLGGSILNMGKKAAGKAALEKMGVAAADKAAVAAAKGTPEFAALAKESAKGGLGGAARHAAAYATESAGKFAGEYLGTGLANGEWDEKGAALEAFSSLGHSAVGFAGTKAYAAVTDPLRPLAGRKAGAQGGIGGNRKAGSGRKGRRRCVRRHRRLRTAAQAAADGGAEQGGAGFDTAHHDQSHPALRQFADRTKQEEAGRFFSGPADGNTPHAEELARGTEKQPDVSGIPSEDGAEFLDTGVMPDGLARQYADMAAKYRPSRRRRWGLIRMTVRFLRPLLWRRIRARLCRLRCLTIWKPGRLRMMRRPDGRRMRTGAVFRPLTAMCAPAVRRAVRLRLRRAVLPPLLRAGLRGSRRCLRANISTAWIRAGARLWRRRRALILRVLRISGKSPRLCAEKSSRRITRGLRRIIRRLPKPNRVTCRRPCVWRMPCLFLKKGFPSLPMRWIRNRAGGLTRCRKGCAVMRRRWRTIRRTGLCAGRRVWRICADIILRVWRNRRGCTRLPCGTSGIGGCVGQA